MGSGIQVTSGSSGRDRVGAQANGVPEWLKHEWLKAEAWPIPKWYVAKPRARKVERYEDYFARELRARYMELEGDFRAVFGNFVAGTFPLGWLDIVTAERVVSLLHQARQALEEDAPDLLTVASALDLIERYMVWLFPPHVALARVPTMRLRVERLSSPDRELFSAQLDRACETAEVDGPDTRLAKLRPVFDEVTGAYNKHVLQSQISSGLQIERLKALRLWGGILLAVFLLATPLVAPTTGGIQDASGARLTGPLPGAAAAWVAGLGVALLGAIGGFLSGLLQVRNARVTLTEYQSSMLKLQLRPLVGSIVALVLYILLAWDIMPGIRVVNPGSYFLVAFVSGFSERFFLKLLELKPDEESSDTLQAVGAGPATPDATPIQPSPRATGGAERAAPDTATL